MAMTGFVRVSALVALALASLCAVSGMAQDAPPAQDVQFHTADRCIACHNGLVTPSGKDVSIGFDWRASVMANSSRDPYWQASVRRETMDHPESSAKIQDGCADCHMPITRYKAKLRGELGQVFAHLPFEADEEEGSLAADGVSCAICHQIGRERLGTPESFNGNFVIDPPARPDERPEYGPYDVDPGHVRVMRSSTEGFMPVKSDHIRQSELCATCHTLITQTLGPGGAIVGRFPEQVPFQEWLHSDYKQTQTCQQCHMPRVGEDVPITRVFGAPREGVGRHVFVGANFLLQQMLNRYHGELSVAALPQELDAAAQGTLEYLASKAARLSIDDVHVTGERLQVDVAVDNLGGHKLPTAYPSRRAWLHVVVRDGGGQVVFESGALNPDGSIKGNDNDTDAKRFEPHYTRTTSPDQAQVYESILRDVKGGVTTGLLSATGYLKDNRLLPHGFDKMTAEPDIAVHGDAATDGDFTDRGDHVTYSVPVTGSGPFRVEAELLYQPIGFRWAHNLEGYHSAAEPRRFTTYYDAMSGAATATLARAAR
jgi:hypothetical protein